MRRVLPVVLVLTVAAAGAIATAAVVRAGAAPAPQVQSGAPSARVLFQVEGLSCGACEGRVTQALTEKRGVRAVEVNLAQKTVTVEYEEGAADPKDLADRITRLGYPARYLASGAGVPPPRRAGAKPAGGCGGSCCGG